MHRFLCALPVVLTGCVFGPGEPFGVLQAALETRYEVPEGRVSQDGFAKLDTNYQLALTRFDVVLDRAAALGSVGLSDAVSFDPANPPPGYSLCHGGHCHADDGRLVPYAEVGVLSAGGNVFRLPLALTQHKVSLLTDFSQPLSCGAECELPLGQLVSAELGVQRFTVEGVVRDGLSSPRLSGDLPFTAELTLPAEPVEGQAAAEAGAEVDRDGPWRVELHLAWVPTPALFDGLDFSQLERTPNGALVLDATHNASTTLELAERLTDALQAEALRFPVSP